MLDNFNSKQRKIIVIVILSIAIICLYVIFNRKKQKEDISLNENILIEENITETNEEKEEEIIIHITGGVKNPGIVRLPEGSRIEDAINSAGGLTEDADISNINLAYIIEDGIKIRIPKLTDNNEEKEEEIITEGKGEALENETSSMENQKETNININKASEEELQQLPGIGASLAMRIVQYRNENGKFSSIEEIKKVNGIGDSKYENIKDLIKVK